VYTKHVFKQAVHALKLLAAAHMLSGLDAAHFLHYPEHINSSKACPAQRCTATIAEQKLCNKKNNLQQLQAEGARVE
jgi:hypothetical protein